MNFAKLIVVVMVLWTSTVARTSWAASSRVLLLRPTAAGATIQEAVTRAEAELRASGFEVVVLPTTAKEPNRADLARDADEHDAFAAISIFGTEGQAIADVWVTDQLTRKTVIRSVDVSSVTPAQQGSALAIRVVELLRASLIELTVPQERTATPPDEVLEFASRNEGRDAEGLTFELGLGALTSFDELGPALGPAARIAYITPIELGLRVSWLGPAFAGRLEGELGTASVRQEMLGLDVLWSPSLSSWRLQPTVALGAGVYHLRASGDLPPPEEGQSDDVWATALQLGGGLGVGLTERLTLRLEGSAVVTTPAVRVTMHGESVGGAGRPSLATTLGLQGRL